jgi:Rps23 Pro-64 3,4-dihydroxylase Tpa1-like proline 4-hydroxylase
MEVNFIDREALRQEFTAAKPFPFMKIENFVDPDFAREVASAYPTFDDALATGRSFKTVNERKKVQITDAKKFSAPILRLHQMLSSPKFLGDLSYITDIPDLIADEELVGGGVHVTGPGGRLDVHIDFNYMEERKLHRRVNLLLYLNPTWQEEWGGQIQLWDKNVQSCQQQFSPALNRCVVFETSEISFHGVTPVSPAAPYPRLSFATYYYTREAPANWKGEVHSTIFRARPEERFRKYVAAPAEKLQRRLEDHKNSLKRGIKRLIRPAR